MKKQISAISFTPKYDELEDRVRLSINYDNLADRVDLMMTRSFVLKLFPTLDEYMFKFYDSSEAIQTQNTPRNDSKKIVEDESTSITDNSNLELYKQEDELLTEVSFSHVKKSKKTLIKFITKQSEVSAKLDEKSIKQIFSIIKSSIPFFAWGISHNI